MNDLGLAFATIDTGTTMDDTFDPPRTLASPDGERAAAPVKPGVGAKPARVVSLSIARVQTAKFSSRALAPLPEKRDNRVVRLPLGDLQERPSPPIFETIRIFEPARIRMSLRRKRVAGASLSPRQLALLGALDAFHQAHGSDWPEVIVIRQSHSAELKTNFSINGSLITLGAHLSASWQDGKEDPAFHAALTEALETMLRMRASQFEPSATLV